MDAVVRTLLGALFMVIASRILAVFLILFAALVSVCIGVHDVADASQAGLLKQRPADGLWVTFDVGGERFQAVVTKPESVEYVLGYVAGSEPQRVPVGDLVRGKAFNKKWSWHLESKTLEFADAAMELCDGTPSMVEKDLNEWITTVQRYCPWSARITKVQDCRAGKHCERVAGLYAGRSPAF